jgi:hypothetical protein
MSEQFFGGGKLERLRLFPRLLGFLLPRMELRLLFHSSSGLFELDGEGLACPV